MPAKSLKRIEAARAVAANFGGDTQAALKIYSALLVRDGLDALTAAVKEQTHVLKQAHDLLPPNADGLEEL